MDEERVVGGCVGVGSWKDGAVGLKTCATGMVAARPKFAGGGVVRRSAVRGSDEERAEDERCSADDTGIGGIGCADR